MDFLKASFRRFLSLPLVGQLRAVTGIDRAIFFTAAGRGWTALAGPITLVFVATFLSAEEQGFYYTFGSVLALQVFFELGLAYVIMQVVSHEKAHLEWTPAGTLEGDPRAKARLASIFRLALRWYAVVAVLVILVLSVAGLIFFRTYAPAGSNVDWKMPWLLVSALTGATLALTPAYGVLEGCGKIAEIAALVLRQAVVGSLLVWITMAAGFKLYAAPAIAFASAVIGFTWLVRKRWPFFRDLLRTEIPADMDVNWRREILPFQWKIALSWLSGYFIFQLANPVLFRYHGAVEAGRMGMTMRVIDSVMALSLAWVSTKSAPFGGYIAKRDFATLNDTFRKATLQAMTVLLLGGAAFLAAYLALRSAGVGLVNRLLDPLAISFLLGNAAINLVIFSEAIYLRAHKEEPFLFNSLLGAALVPAIMYFLGRPYGALGIAAGLFCGSLVIGLPLATYVFRKKRLEWHGHRSARIVANAEK